MLDITKIPTEQFPMNWERYSHIMDELQHAARGFALLDEKGWPGGRDLDQRLMEIWSQLHGVWEDITATERRLREQSGPK